jgi:hypothetical protein
LLVIKSISNSFDIPLKGGQESTFESSLECAQSGTQADTAAIRMNDWGLRGVPRGRNLKWWLQVYVPPLNVSTNSPAQRRPS